jgi:Cu(I)/Ag(I) efflux system membrane protein CusA/SilA
MQRIAVPMIGGMISSTLLTLIVIPAIFGLVKGYGLPREERFDSPALATAKPPDRLQRVREPAK